MKQTTLVKTMLAALIVLTWLMAMSGCNWGGGHDDHNGGWDHQDVHHDNH